MSDVPPRLIVSRHGDVIAVGGEIDAHSAPELEQVVADLPDDQDARLDMSKVDFMDSSGLRVLIDLHNRLDGAGHRLVLDHPSRSVIRLLEISGLTDHLNVSQD